MTSETPDEQMKTRRFDTNYDFQIRPLLIPTVNTPEEEP